MKTLIVSLILFAVHNLICFSLIFFHLSGAIKSDYRLSPKDTLCGDLNKGYVPLNPMLQTITGQPYPL